jgi:hypothetical protein
MIPAFELGKIFHALHCAAIAIGLVHVQLPLIRHHAMRTNGVWRLNQPRTHRVGDCVGLKADLEAVGERTFSSS